MKKNKATIILSILLILALAVAGYFGYKYFTSTQKGKQVQIDLQDRYADKNDNNLEMVFENQVVTLANPAKKVDDMFYLPLDLVLQLTDNLHYDEAEKTLTYTDSRDVIRMTAGETTYYYNNEPMDLEIAFADGYLPSALVAKFANFRLSYNEKYHILSLDKLEKPQTIGMVQFKETEGDKAKKVEDIYEYFYDQMVEEGQEGKYYYRLYPGMTFVILEDQDPYYYVRSQEGFLGYIKKDLIGSMGQVLESNAVSDYMPVHKPALEGKINLVWHQVFNTTANNSIREKMALTRGVNVISPTWFHIEDTEGTVSSIADISYVRWAQQNGYQVWPLFSNSFDKEITHAVLSSTAKREKVIRQILSFVDLYELDGINIDFEEVPTEDGPGFVQFVKELSLFLRQKGVTVSVDMYVPKPWTEHYGRAEIGKYIDYLIIMGYDEHWSTSPESGSVASIDFVREGVVDTLDSVPANKVILGLPFYTRLWQERPSGNDIKVTSKAYGMGYGKQLMIDKGARIEWDLETAQYYGQYEEGDSVFKMWLEDKRSLDQKLSVASGYNLAGVAGWKLGLENEDAWVAIGDYLSK